jgi:hypothetical protein
VAFDGAPGYYPNTPSMTAVNLCGPNGVAVMNNTCHNFGHTLLTTDCFVLAGLARRAQAPSSTGSGTTVAVVASQKELLDHEICRFADEGLGRVRDDSEVGLVVVQSARCLVLPLVEDEYGNVDSPLECSD